MLTPLVAAAAHAAAHAAAPWARLYDDHASVQTAVMFAHLGGMLIGGGFAVAADRLTLRASRAPTDALRAQALGELRAAHGPVLAGLAAAVASGVLLVAADAETYLTSGVLWLKLALLALLLANGLRLRAAERAAAVVGPAATWRRLRRAAIASAALWLAILLTGVLLVNASTTT